MAIRKVVRYGDKILRTPTKEVHKMSSKIRKIVDDLIDTLYAQNGVGLAAPQIGESYKIFVIDTATGNEPLNPIVFVNPKIIKKSGAMISNEGCLSFPEAYTDVKRYSKVTVTAKDENGRPFMIEAPEGSLLCKAIQHENDHLNGILFIDHVINRFVADGILSEKGLSPIDPVFLLEEPELDKIIEQLQETAEPQKIMGTEALENVGE